MIPLCSVTTSVMNGKSREMLVSSRSSVKAELVVSLTPSPWTRHGGLAEGGGRLGSAPLLPPPCFLPSSVPHPFLPRPPEPVPVPVHSLVGKTNGSTSDKDVLSAEAQSPGAHGGASKSSSGGTSAEVPEGVARPPGTPPLLSRGPRAGALNP